MGILWEKWRSGEWCSKLLQRKARYKWIYVKICISKEYFILKNKQFWAGILSLYGIRKFNIWKSSLLLDFPSRLSSTCCCYPTAIKGTGALPEKWQPYRLLLVIPLLFPVVNSAVILAGKQTGGKMQWGVRIDLHRADNWTFNLFTSPNRYLGWHLLINGIIRCLICSSQKLITQLLVKP